jgi:hypothetical protein
MDNHVINGVIEYLYKHDHYLPYILLYEYGNRGTKVTDFALVSSELKRLKLVEVRFDTTGNEEFVLNVPTRNKLDKMLMSGTVDFYGYFIDQETNKISVTEERLKLELEKLRNEYNDYPVTKQRAREAHKWGQKGLHLSRVSIGISIVTLAITLTTILLSRYKVWPFDK